MIRDRKFGKIYVATAVAALLPVVPAIAQDASAGKMAQSSIGQVGQRQTSAEAAPSIKPMARIDNRVQNRIESRIQNRIDQSYNPQTATSSFAAADEQIQRAGRSRLGTH